MAWANANRDKLDKQGFDVDEWNQSSQGKVLPPRAAKQKRGDKPLFPTTKAKGKR